MRVRNAREANGGYKGRGLGGLMKREVLQVRLMSWMFALRFDQNDNHLQAVARVLGKGNEKKEISE